MSMRSIYRKIARENGVSVAEVKMDMQAAIDHAYKKENKTAEEIKAQAAVNSKPEIPTAGELITHLAERVRGR